MYVARTSKVFLLCLLLIFCKLAAVGYVLDWDTVSWTPGATDVTFSNVDGSGVDIRVQFLAETEFLSSDYPRIDSSFHGGTYENTLTIYMNWDADDKKVRVRVTFSEDVENVSFGIFDVDQGSGSSPNFTWVDQIRSINAEDSSANPASYSASYNATYIQPNGAGTAYNAINGGVPGTSPNGNLWIDFGSDDLNQFQFIYNNRGNQTQADPDAQAVGLYDIQFTTLTPVIPENNSAWMFAGIGAFLITRFGIGRWKVRKSLS